MTQTREAAEFRHRYIPKHVALFVFVHLSALYGLYLAATAARWGTVVWAAALTPLSVLGVTMGAHRLWSHRAYKAAPALQMALAALTALAFQFSSITWVRDHRAHHAFSDTRADPHDSTKGLFFSHVGWLLADKDPLIKRKAAGIDLSDVYANPVLRFQHDNFLMVGGLSCFALPTLAPLLWGEAALTAWHLNLLRYVLSLHCVFLINSAAHHWGGRPYDTRLAPTQNALVSALALGEGFHNFHHAFPWDYRAAERHQRPNATAALIDVCARLGWAYDLQEASPRRVQERVRRTGAPITS